MPVSRSGHLYCLLLIIIGCTSTGSHKSTEPDIIQSELSITKEPIVQIAEYIRHIYQDKDGHFWLGTNGYGVAHYDGDSISYYLKENGFNGFQITGIAEDTSKDIWFATDLGIVKYDWSVNSEGEKRFTNYHEHFGNMRFWSICADRKGNIWAGSVNDIYKFDGKRWTTLKLPYQTETKDEFISKATTWSISEDSKGNIWISTNGLGIYKYDGQNFTNYSTEDGLADDSVDVIMEDSKNNIWIGTRFGGVSRFDGKTFTNFNQQNGDIGNNEVCDIFEDSSGNIWMSSEGFGVYRYDGTSFTNYAKDQGLGISAVQDIYEDKNGRIWVGGGGGLYRFNFESGSFSNVTRNGPW